MPLTTKQKQKLRKFVRELESIRGRHTELVSVYVPSGYELIKIIQHLEQEQGTASNIKDARTRKNVIDSLERAVRHLRLYKKTPPNGLAVFSGNASKNESKIDIQVWSIEPPEPLKTRMYRCDQTFVLDLLKEMMEHKETYGLLVLDRREATIGLLKGSAITVVYHMTSGVPGKTRAGGQSAARFSRLRDEMAKEFYNRIGNAANKTLLEMKELKGIIIGGPGPTKEEFLEGGYLNNELKRKVLAVEDITYTDESGLHHLVEKSQGVLAKEIITREKEIMQKFFEMLATTLEKVAYGQQEVEKALGMGAVDTLLLSEDLDPDLIEKFENEAEKTGTTTEIISTETREGVQLKEISGIAAILRFPIG